MGRRKILGSYFDFVDHVYGETINEANFQNLNVTKACRYVLCQKLKSVCYKNGREKNALQTAGILHQLAKVQRRFGNILHSIGQINRLKNLEKIAFIRSAVLLNAAIVRKPNNVGKIEEDLKKLCFYVIKLANAQNKEANLVEKAKQIFEKVVKMRKTVSDNLETMPLLQKKKTPEEDKIAKFEHAEKIESLQLQVADQYKGIMGDIMNYCVSVMGNPPCKYALVGMGSLARKEITPYSDFENIVILEDGIEKQNNYEEILEYFRWVATLFQIMLVNFRETVVRFMAIPGLKWYYDMHTPCGISPDGLAQSACKNSIGRQEFSRERPWKTELIKPVADMLKYLKPEEDQNNGFHLAEMLSVTCFVSGDHHLHQIFQEKAKEKFEFEDSGQCREEIMSQVVEFNTFYSMIYEEWKMHMDLKRIAYRSITIFMSALGRYYKISTPSCFDIARNLPDMSEHIRQQMLLAISTACEIRLRAYTESYAQNDMVAFKIISQGYDALSEMPQGKVTKKLIELVGRESYFCCFKCAFYLQSVVARVFHLNFKNEFGVLNALQFKEEHFDKPGFELYVKYHVGLFSEILKVHKYMNPDTDFTLPEHEIIARASLTLQNPETALKHFQLAVNSQELDKTSMHCASLHLRVAICVMKQENYKEGLKSCQKTDTLIKNYTSLGNPQHSNTISLSYCTHFLMATCHFYLENITEAIEHFLFCSTLSFPKSFVHIFRAPVFAALAQCAFAQGDIPACLKWCKKEMTERMLLTTDETKDPDIANCRAIQGLCHLGQGNTDKGLEDYATAQATFEAANHPKWNKKAAYLELSQHWLKLVNMQSEDVENLRQIFDSIDSTFVRYDNKDDFTAAPNSEQSKTAKGLNLVFEMLPDKFSSLPKNMGGEETPASMMNLAYTQMQSEHYIQAMDYFKIAQLLWRFLETPVHKRNNTECYRNIAECFMRLHCYEGAVKNFLQELQCLQLNNEGQKSNTELVEVLNNIEKCYLVLNNKEQALQYSKLRDDIVTKMEVTEKKSSKAIAFKKEGRQFVDKNNFEEALKQFEQELSVLETMGSDANTEDSIAECLFWTALCYFKLQVYHQAMSLLQQARDIWETKPTKDYTKKIIKCLKWLGKSQYEMGNLQQAFTFFQSEFDLRNQENKNVHRDPHIALCHYNIALCYEKCYDNNEAASHFKLAQITWENIENPRWATNIAECETAIARLFTQ